MANEKDFVIHPQTIILYLVLGGITMLFLGFTAAYMYNRIQFGLQSVALPTLFYFNTLLLLICSYLFNKCKKAYLDDNTVLYQKLLWATLACTILFLFLQALAWWQLKSMNTHLIEGNMTTYLYALSGLHFAHVIAGIPFLCHFIYVAHYRMKEPVSVLVYFADPDKKRSLKLLSTYWHYLDFLWIFLVLFFLLNYLI